MKTKLIQLVLSNDWQGMYVDGILELEARNINMDIILNVLGCQYKDLLEYKLFTVQQYLADETYISKLDKLPEKFEDIPDELLD